MYSVKYHNKLQLGALMLLSPHEVYISLIYAPGFVQNTNTLSRLSLSPSRQTNVRFALDLVFRRCHCDAHHVRTHKVWAGPTHLASMSAFSRTAWATCSQS